MPGIEDALARLHADPAFRAQLATDPRSALAGYELSADDLSVLARKVGANGRSVVEQRTSRAGFFGLFAEITEDAGVVIHGPSSADE
ncbi:MAG: hypothetical protein ACJ72N_16125 [Labedaea sp.]